MTEFKAPKVSNEKPKTASAKHKCEGQTPLGFSTLWMEQVLRTQYLRRVRLTQAETPSQKPY